MMLEDLYKKKKMMLEEFETFFFGVVLFAFNDNLFTYI